MVDIKLSVVTYSGVHLMVELKRIGIVKRASALLLDAILLSVLAAGVMFIISLICNFEHEQELYYQASGEWEEFTEEYGEAIAGYFGCTFEKEGEDRVMRKDGEIYSFVAVMDEFAGLNGEIDYDKPNAETVAEAYGVYQAMSLTPISKLYAQNNYLFSLLFMIMSLGILSAYLILEFLVPILLKNGQTVGKKIFGICLVRSNSVKINNVALFTRTILGKFAVETMFPILLVFMFFFGVMGWLALALLAALTLMNLILFFATKNRTPIHDRFADTVAVDINLQMIYQTEEEMIEKKTLQHLKNV